MPPAIFVDAGAWIAISNRQDRYHRAATETYRSLLAQRATLVTTNLVVAEAYVLIRRGGGHSGASRFLESLRQTGRVERVFSDGDLERVAESILARYAD